MMRSFSWEDEVRALKAILNKRREERADEKRRGDEEVGGVETTEDFWDLDS